MPNCESNRNGWKDGKSKCNCCGKEKDSCCCESKDSHCENDRHEHEHDCHKKDSCCCKPKDSHCKNDKHEHEHNCHKKDSCCCEPKDSHCKNDKHEHEHNCHKKDSCCCELKDSHCKNDKQEHEHNCHKKDWKDKEHECNHHDKKKECCCKESMKEALELLSNHRIKPDIKFDEFAFIGHNFLVGANIQENLGDNDNISSPNAQFKGFESCTCDLIKLFADRAFYPIPNNNANEVDIPNFDNINFASLCDIQAVVFNYDGDQTDFEDDLTRLLDEFNNKCKIKCDECCCNEGILNKIFNPCNPNDTVSLTASWLAVKDAKILGKIGTILVLSSTVAKRIYFVCLDSVGFINF